VTRVEMFIKTCQDLKEKVVDEETQKCYCKYFT